MVLPNLAFRRPPRPQPVSLSDEEKKKRCPEPPVRRFVWTKYTQSGFPHRVNHATVAWTVRNGRRLMLSVGGYHTDDKNNQDASAQDDDDDSSPTFRTGPIDMHCMDVGKLSLAVCFPDSRHWLFIIRPFNTGVQPLCGLTYGLGWCYCVLGVP